MAERSGSELSVCCLKKHAQKSLTTMNAQRVCVHNELQDQTWNTCQLLKEFHNLMKQPNTLNLNLDVNVISLCHVL